MFFSIPKLHINNQCDHQYSNLYNVDDSKALTSEKCVFIKEYLSNSPFSLLRKKPNNENAFENLILPQPFQFEDQLSRKQATKSQKKRASFL